jgi:diguanylate cyclase (GGDEF)-like protein
MSVHPRHALFSAIKFALDRSRRACHRGLARKARLAADGLAALRPCWFCLLFQKQGTGKGSLSFAKACTHSPVWLSMFNRICLALWMVCALVPAATARAADEPFSPIGFTSREQAFIEHAGTIKMCVDPDWAPFERINEQGRHEGIAADLIQLVAQRVGLNIEIHSSRSWEESIMASKNKRCQIMSFLNQSPVRDEWLVFTEPVFYDQNVIITREEHAFIGDLKGAKRQSLALPRGTMVEERVRRDFPDLTVVTTGSESEAMALVSERKVDMTIRSLIVAAYAIKKEGLFNLKIAGQVPGYENELRIGVLKDEPVLRDILDKGIETITPQEREAIANKHVSIKVQRGTDYTLVWQITVVGGVVILLVLYWNRKLQALNKKLERLSVTDKLTGLFNRLKLDEVFESEVQRAIRFEQIFSVIILDMDEFKRVNDSYGHQTGDLVLVAVARLLEANVRVTDIVGRWGGEEFVVICPHTEQAGALALAEDLCKIFRDYDFPVVHRKTASFGVSTYRPGDQVKDLVARADAAMYEAKRKGRDRVEAR